MTGMLSREAAAFDDTHARKLHEYNAMIGSQNLVDAILRARGEEPPVRLVPPPPSLRTKPRKLITREEARAPDCCPHCGAPKRRPGLLIATIQEAVTAYFGLHIGAMTTSRRAYEVAHPRQIAMYLASELTGKSLPEIGRRFGGRDHTTVIHAIKAVKRRIEADYETAVDVAALRESLEP